LNEAAARDGVFQQRGLSGKAVLDELAEGGGGRELFEAGGLRLEA
jgi:hypothetical protein